MGRVRRENEVEATNLRQRLRRRVDQDQRPPHCDAGQYPHHSSHPESTVSRLNVALQNDLKLLHFARDEIALQAHLLKGELKERWADLDKQWQGLKEHIGRAEVASEAAKSEVEAAIQLLVGTLDNGFANIKRAFQS
ncbi:MAG: hypothetical protein ACREUE_00290 [Panacagrimonas sp.]